MNFAEDLANHLRPLLPQDKWTYQSEGETDPALELWTPGSN